MIFTCQDKTIEVEFDSIWFDENYSKPVFDQIIEEALFGDDPSSTNHAKLVVQAASYSYNASGSRHLNNLTLNFKSDQRSGKLTLFFHRN